MLKQMLFDNTENKWKGHLQGELDAVQAPKLITSVEAYLKEHPVDMELDCTQLVFVDSMGLGALVKARKMVEAANASMKLTNMKKRIYKLFVITGLERSFGLEVDQ